MFDVVARYHIIIEVDTSLTATSTFCAVGDHSLIIRAPSTAHASLISNIIKDCFHSIATWIKS